MIVTLDCLPATHLGDCLFIFIDISGMQIANRDETEL